VPRPRTVPMPQSPIFLEDGSQHGVSRTAFRRMRKADKRELMIQWFHQNFEDPAESTPHDSAEGGYQWIWGGPYDVADELFSKFGDIASEALIDEVVKHVERHGLSQWAPVHTADDYDPPETPEEPAQLDAFLDEPSPLYGSAEEHQARLRARAAVDELRHALDTPPPTGVGHNRPPKDDEPQEITELHPALAELSAELAKPNPVISVVKRWTKPLRDALIATAMWTGRKLDKGLDAAVAAGAVWFLTQYGDAIRNAFDAVIEWLHIAANTVF
jgi:hypothetical protein